MYVLLFIYGVEALRIAPNCDQQCVPREVEVNQDCNVCGNVKNLMSGGPGGGGPLINVTESNDNGLDEEEMNTIIERLKNYAAHPGGPSGNGTPGGNTPNGPPGSPAGGVPPGSPAGGFPPGNVMPPGGSMPPMVAYETFPGHNDLRPHTHPVVPLNNATVTLIKTVVNYVPMVYTTMIERPPVTVRLPPEILTVTPIPRVITKTADPLIFRMPGPTVSLPPKTVTKICTPPPQILRPESVTLTVTNVKELPPQTMTSYYSVQLPPQLVTVTAPPVTIQQPATSVYVYTTVVIPPSTVTVPFRITQTVTALRLVQSTPRTVLRTIMPGQPNQPYGGPPQNGFPPGVFPPGLSPPGGSPPGSVPPNSPGIPFLNHNGYSIEDVTPPGSPSRMFKFTKDGSGTGVPFNYEGGPGSFTGGPNGPRPLGNGSGNGRNASVCFNIGGPPIKNDGNANCNYGSIHSFSGNNQGAQCTGCRPNDVGCMRNQMSGTCNQGTKNQMKNCEAKEQCQVNNNMRLLGNTGCNTTPTGDRVIGGRVNGAPMCGENDDLQLLYLSDVMNSQNN